MDGNEGCGGTVPTEPPDVRPVHPDNLHNEGNAFSGGAQFGWNISPGSVLTIVAGAGRSNRKFGRRGR